MLPPRRSPPSEPTVELPASPERTFPTVMLLPLLAALLPIQTLWSSPSPVAHAATGPMTILEADLDGDGRDDLVTISRRAGGYGGVGITTRLSLGNGTFGPPVHATADWDLNPGGGIDPNVATGDFNRDGLADLVVAYCSSSSTPFDLLYAYGDGTGRLEAPLVLDTLPLGLRCMTVADIDLDGRDDVLYNERNDVRFALGEAAGTLASPRPLLDVPLRLFALVAEDLTADGSVDLLLSVPGLGGGFPLSNTTVVLPGTGSFPFS